MIELGMIRDIVAIFGVIAGFSYYVLTVRNADKVRKMQLISRIREQGGKSFESEVYGVEIMAMEWTDFDDFRAKYDSTVNPENWAKRNLWWGFYQEVGYMLHEGIVDVEIVYNLLGGNDSLIMWMKFGPIILEQRKWFDDPSWYKYFEYFADEMKKHRVRLGFEPEIKDADGVITVNPSP